VDEPINDMASNAASKNGFISLSLCPPQAGYWCSRRERRPDVSLIVLGNEPRQVEWAQTSDTEKSGEMPM
jgi:hypothetical protein